MNRIIRRLIAVTIIALSAFAIGQTPTAHHTATGNGGINPMIVTPSN